ncbi:MAG: type II toxin-antitoxin system MqsR family toxin [Candidatus Heimdallarchaeota archaeon]
MPDKKPSYDLEEIKRMFLNRKGRYFRDEARDDAVKINYLSIEDMMGAIKNIAHSEFDKTMESETVRGLMLDVYHSSDGAEEIYIKFSKNQSGTGVILWSFKRK